MICVGIYKTWWIVLAEGWKAFIEERGPKMDGGGGGRSRSVETKVGVEPMEGAWEWTPSNVVLVGVIVLLIIGALVSVVLAVLDVF